MRISKVNDLQADRRTAASPWLWIGLAVWAIASIAGFLWLLSFSATPGSASTREPTWPQESRIVRDSARANLVVFMHPHCPCSRASLTELTEIMAGCAGQISAHVLFLKPREMPDGWEVSNLWHRAAAIRGVRVHADEEGCEAQRFGALTSGHAALYDQDGRLRFRGGITVARGHAGDNDGRQMVIDRLTGTADQFVENVVFGCPLFEGIPQRPGSAHRCSAD